jgi:hypothetical protein
MEPQLIVGPRIYLIYHPSYVLRLRRALRKAASLLPLSSVPSPLPSFLFPSPFQTAPVKHTLPHPSGVN